MKIKEIEKLISACEVDFDDFYDRVVNTWEADLSDETITKMYEEQEWTKVLMFTLND